MASWNRCSSVCTLLPLAESALHKEQIALLLSFWSNERKREKKPTQMMLVFVSGCLAMLHLGVCLLLLFSPITSAACRCFFLYLSSSAHFFPLWPNTLLPLLLNFLSSNTPVFVLPKSFSDPLPTPHLHFLLPLATTRMLGWISHMCLGTKPVPFFCLFFCLCLFLLHCTSEFTLLLLLLLFHFIYPAGSGTFSRVRGLAMSREHIFQVPLNL